MAVDFEVWIIMQVATEASDLESYFCSHLRLMPLCNIDPSLAIGFYCRSAGESLGHSCSPVPLYLNQSCKYSTPFRTPREQKLAT